MRRAGRLLRRPLERFLQIEAASGVVLLACAAAALLWANSPWAAQYHGLWQHEVGLGIGPWHATRSLAWWVNDVLMVLFFFVAGLEIRREVHEGELSQWRRAALPLVAALGGMVAPACVYLAMQPPAAAHSGWGVPMATDIAFALGVLALLGKRVPPALRVLLLALAVIDDLGAIVVIAVWYSAPLQGAGVAVALAALVGLWTLRRWGVRHKAAYVATGAVLWAGIYTTGVHPTLAGVILGLLTPVQRSHDETPSVAEDLITRLHPWVAWLVMPVFALANAGVTLPSGMPDPSGLRVSIAVALGLLAGKPLGILTACAVALRLRLAVLPAGLDMRQLLVLGTVAGIGFTMSLFVAQLAFGDAALLDAAKLGIVAGSGLSALCGIGLGRWLLRPPSTQEARRVAQSADEAEASTDQ